MNTPTLSQLADIGAKAAYRVLRDDEAMIVAAVHPFYKDEAQARKAFAKAVLDAVGFKFPADPEREAFDAWVAGLPGAVLEPYREQMFDAWKAGRAARDKEAMRNKQPNPETFEAHGHTWFKHTPGDPCPVDGERVVGVFLSIDEDGYFRERSKLAKEWYWGVENEEHYPIIGWRHA